MSDDIFEVSTSFNDVAELGQGYVDRADGERILLALPRATREGEGVRFIVHLADGTPAFAGAGRCVQVSDQGTQVPPEARFETLLDSLAFDERSRPVYDYIVAVRQMAYSGGEPEGAAVEGEMVYDASAEESPIPATWNENEAVTVSSDPSAPDSTSPTSELAVVTSELAVVTSELAVVTSELAVGIASPATQELEEGDRSDPTPIPTPSGTTPMPEAPVELAPAILASILPEPLPTGILTRPAIAGHWQPRAPRPARPSTRPHRFRYQGDTLPIPHGPARPELEPGQSVRPAPSPTN